MADTTRPVAGPTISVVIPCYNYGHYLPDAVRSVLDQTGVELDVIIVDDASTDDSRVVAQALADTDPRIRFVAHENNMGHIATYNDGLMRVEGDYVVLLSADDLLAPGALERSSILMEQNDDIGLVYGYAQEFSGEVPSARPVRSRSAVWDGTDWIARMCRRGTNIIVNPEAMLRRSVMDALIGYTAELPQTADMDLWMRAAAMSNVGRVNGPVQAFYRVHDANMHLSDFRGLFVEMRARRDTFELFFQASGRELPNAGRLRDRARRAIAREATRAACAALGDDRGFDGTQAEELADFAAETWPSIVTTALWRRYRWRQKRPAGAIRRALEARTASLKSAVRWRRWRRFGT